MWRSGIFIFPPAAAADAVVHYGIVVLLLLQKHELFRRDFIDNIGLVSTERSAQFAPVGSSIVYSLSLSLLWRKKYFLFVLADFLFFKIWLFFCFCFWLCVDDCLPPVRWAGVLDCKRRPDSSCRPSFWAPSIVRLVSTTRSEGPSFISRRSAKKCVFSFSFFHFHFFILMIFHSLSLSLTGHALL